MGPERKDDTRNRESNESFGIDTLLLTLFILLLLYDCIYTMLRVMQF